MIQEVLRPLLVIRKTGHTRSFHANTYVALRRTNKLAGDANSVSLPVTPDTVRQLHEGEGEVQTEEEEQIPGGFIRQDRSEE